MGTIMNVVRLTAIVACRGHDQNPLPRARRNRVGQKREGLTRRRELPAAHVDDVGTGQVASQHPKRDNAPVTFVATSS